MELVTRTRKELAFLAVALLLAYGIYQTVGIALSTDVPVVAVTSPSMEPALQRGDMVVVQGKPFNSIQEGDILVFSAEHKGEQCKSIPIIHRVVARDGERLSTRGDNNDGQIHACYTGYSCFIPSEGKACPSNGKMVNIEKNITEEQVKGVAAMTLPALGHVKLIPTCLYLQISRPGEVSPNICPF